MKLTFRFEEEAARAETQTSRFVIEEPARNAAEVCFYLARPRRKNGENVQAMVAAGPQTVQEAAA